MIRIRRSLLLGWLAATALCWVVPLQAQQTAYTVTGRVRDADTGGQLAGGPEGKRAGQGEFGERVAVVDEQELGVSEGHDRGLAGRFVPRGQATATWDGPQGPTCRSGIEPQRHEEPRVRKRPCQIFSQLRVSVVKFRFRPNLGFIRPTNPSRAGLV